jgi:hypothetical protein
VRAGRGKEDGEKRKLTLVVCVHLVGLEEVHSARELLQRSSAGHEKNKHGTDVWSLPASISFARK